MACSITNNLLNLVKKQAYVFLICLYCIPISISANIKLSAPKDFLLIFFMVYL